MEKELKPILCNIVNAAFKESWDDPNSGGEGFYENCVVLILEDPETGRKIASVLTKDDIQKITGDEFPLTSRQMIKFAHELRRNSQPVEFMFPEGEEENILTTEMIMLNDDFQSPNVITPVPLPAPRRNTEVKRFDFKYRKKL